MAQATRVLFARPEDWIHRRAERIYFKDRQVAHHQVTVDFTLPPYVAAVSTFEGKNVYIAPLFLLTKDSPSPLREGKRSWRRFAFFGERLPDLAKRIVPDTPYSNLNLVDQEGRRLPILTRLQSAQITSAMLLEEAEAIIGSGRVTGRLRNEILAVPYRNRLTLGNVLSWLLYEKVCCWDPRYKLRKSKSFSELIHTFASYYLIVCLLTDDEPRRPIYKLSYDEHTNEDIPKPRGAFLRSIGWRSEQYSVPLTEIGASSSYHVEIEIPEELEINAVILAGKRYKQASKLEEAGNRNYLIQMVGNVNEGIIYIPEPLPGRQAGRVWVKLRARRQRFLRGGLAASLVITTMLFFSSFAVLLVIAERELEAATATLLLVPALVAAYLARPGEHDITTKMLRWARIALIVDALLPGVAVYLLLTARIEAPKIFLYLGSHYFSEPPLGWLVLAGFSFVISLLFAVSNIIPRPHGQTIYQIQDSGLAL